MNPLILFVANFISLSSKRHWASFDGSPSNQRYRGNQVEPYGSEAFNIGSEPEKPSSQPAGNQDNQLNNRDNQDCCIPGSSDGSFIDGIAGAWIKFR